MLMSDIGIITDGGRRRRWSAAAKLRIVEATLPGDDGITAVARRNGGAGRGWRQRVPPAPRAQVQFEAGVAPAPAGVWGTLSTTTGTPCARPTKKQTSTPGGVPEGSPGVQARTRSVRSDGTRTITPEAVASTVGVERADSRPQPSAGP